MAAKVGRVLSYTIIVKFDTVPYSAQDSWLKGCSLQQIPLRIPGRYETSYDTASKYSVQIHRAKYSVQNTACKYKVATTQRANTGRVQKQRANTGCKYWLRAGLCGCGGLLGVSLCVSMKQ
jgi:hypothetical protein